MRVCSDLGPTPRAEPTWEAVVRRREAWIGSGGSGVGFRSARAGGYRPPPSCSHPRGQRLPGAPALGPRAPRGRGGGAARRRPLAGGSPREAPGPGPRPPPRRRDGAPRALRGRSPLPLPGHGRALGGAGGSPPESLLQPRVPGEVEPLRVDPGVRHYSGQRLEILNEDDEARKVLGHRRSSDEARSD